MGQLDGSDQRALDRRDFVKAQLVYFILAAIDGHAKNFSVRLTRTGFESTPLYDVMNVHHACRKRTLEWEKMTLAMAFGKKKHCRLRDLAARHIEETFAQCRLSPTKLRDAIDEVLATALDDDFARSTALPHGFPEKLFAATCDGVRAQAALLREHWNG